MLGGCAVSGDKPDEQLPVWYPAWVYRLPPKDSMDAQVNRYPCCTQPDQEDSSGQANAVNQTNAAYQANASNRPDGPDMPTTQPGN